MLPVTDAVTRDILALPVFPGMTEDEQKYVVGKIQEFVVCGL